MILYLTKQKYIKYHSPLANTYIASLNSKKCCKNPLKWLIHFYLGKLFILFQSFLLFLCCFNLFYEVIKKFKVDQ